MNKLLLGDNLEILKTLDSESVDLIYLDPPFFSNRNYEVIWGDKGEVRSFQDRWSGGVEHYIGWLKERVEEMHRILKPTGSIFLHCDWHANAEIKVFILNKVFGEENFRGEVVWQRTAVHNDAKKKLAVVSDTIWYYSKGKKICWNPAFTDLTDEAINTRYRYEDEKGRFHLGPIDSPSPRPNMIYEWNGFQSPAKGWRYSKETMAQLDTENKIWYPTDKNKRPRLKLYLEETKGALLGNVWTDIGNVQGHAKERIGYPTQKPEALLERIITMASNEGDVVLDAFVGGGTTVAVAERLRRKWIGIDQSVMAIKVTEMRLKKPQRDLLDLPFIVQLHKYDYDTLRYQDAFEFETWIVQQFGGVANSKQRGDLGIDGKTKDGVPIQVKRSDAIGRNVIDNLKSASERFDKTLFEANKAAGKSIGIIIAFSFGKGAIQEVARLKNHDGVIIELVTVENVVPIAKKPKLTLTCNDLGLNVKKLREIEFVAVGESESGIEFYAWDFNHEVENGFKADVMIDKTGKQTHAFKAGSYKVAVKVVDNEGIESVEIITLKTNGVLETGN
ncbi:MAG: DNA methyltransferase [Methylococcaceae bacterium]